MFQHASDEQLLAELLRRNPSSVHAPAMHEDHKTACYTVGIGKDNHATIRVWNEALRELGF
jgi:hypothetical protein